MAPPTFLHGLTERLFKLREQGSSVRVEILGGATTFITMAYIIVVNPAILSYAGIPVGPSTVATILTSVFGCLLMGLLANRPIAVAPYMGENAFIAFGLAALGIGWQQRLGTVFVSGLAFLVITLLGVRSWLANSISSSLKHSFAVGIGLFLAFIGLYETGIVTSSVTGMEPSSLPTRPDGLLLARQNRQPARSPGSPGDTRVPPDGHPAPPPGARRPADRHRRHRHARLSARLRPGPQRRRGHAVHRRI